MKGHDAGGETAAGPAVDLSRPASELSPRELDARLAEWIGWTIWRNPLSSRTGAVWAYSPGTDVTAGPTTAPAPAASIHARDVPGSIPRYSTTHEGAAAIRAHVRSLPGDDAWEFVDALWNLLQKPDAEDYDGPSTFDMLCASPRQQADAAYMAFLHQPAQAAQESQG